MWKNDDDKDRYHYFEVLKIGDSGKMARDLHAKASIFALPFDITAVLALLHI